MTENRDNRGDKKEKKEPLVVTVTLAAGEVKNHQIPVTAFVALGRRELAGKTVYFYIGQNYQQAATSSSGTDGRASALIQLPPDAKGAILVSAKSEGMPYPVSTTVDIPEGKKEDILVVAKLDIEPTGLWYDEHDYSHILWTPRAFDESGKSVKAGLHIVGARPFRIIGLDPPMPEGKIFDIKVSEVPKTYEVIVTTPELLEVDVFVEGVDLEDEFMLDGARQPKLGFFKRRYLERRERRR